MHVRSSFRSDPNGCACPCDALDGLTRDYKRKPIPSAPRGLTPACRDRIKIALAARIQIRDPDVVARSDKVLKKQWCRTKPIAQNHRITVTIRDDR